LPYETYYDRVTRHFRETGVWERVIRRFPPKAIESAVKQIYERYVARNMDPEELDWATVFETLIDHETIDDFLSELEEKRLIPEADETPKDVYSLLEKLGLEMPDIRDPNYEYELTDLLSELSSRVLKAESKAGRVEVMVAGKKQLWGSKKVTEYIQNLFSQLHQLKSELEREKKRREEVEKRAKLIKFTPLKDFKEGFVPYIAGITYETDDAKWLREKEALKLIRIVKEEMPPIEQVAKEALAELEAI